MSDTLFNLTCLVVFLPLLGSLIAGLFAKRLGVSLVHAVTIGLMLVALSCAVAIFYLVMAKGYTLNANLYDWVDSGSFSFSVGFLVDPLSSIMMLIVCFVSTIVHIYSIGYMKGDPGDQRFFCYVSLFTFMMLMLLTANNFMQLFFGWEGVGLVSYLLIGFWFDKESAAVGSFKAFIVNRVGDVGLILALSAILTNVGSLDYTVLFSNAETLSLKTTEIFPGHPWSMATVISIFLFIGAMGKSAQVPLHVWLPESMEGPTPISALIHAATMVTAGVFLVARMSPLFEYSQVALSMVLVIGATGALFLGILAFIDNDIKRIIAYSTMSQLGYMMAGNGVSAFNLGIFHLLTHACFKALLFLSAGSVIVAMHHNQDIRKMGGLRKYIPVTYICFLVGSLALAAIPPTAGFYSKDSLIDAVGLSTIPGAGYAYVCLVLGCFVTAYYIFRAFFMTFHGEERFEPKERGGIKEYWVMLFPMSCLAVPSLILGIFLAPTLAFQYPSLLGNAISIHSEYNVAKLIAEHVSGTWAFFVDSFSSVTLWCALAGIFMAWFNTLACPAFPAMLQRRLYLIYLLLKYQFGFDAFNDYVLVRSTVFISQVSYRFGDQFLVDDAIVAGSANGFLQISHWLKRFQTGYIYHYVFVMMVSILVFLIWTIW